MKSEAFPERIDYTRDIFIQTKASSAFIIKLNSIVNLAFYPTNQNILYEPIFLVITSSALYALLVFGYPIDRISRNFEIGNTNAWPT